MVKEQSLQQSVSVSHGVSGVHGSRSAVLADHGKTAQGVHGRKQS